MKAIEVKSIRKTYKDWLFGKEDIILSSISFSVSKGTSFGIIGQSGSGKSTLARIICGLIKPDSGQILINSQNLKGIGNNKINMVFQNPKTSLSPKMNVKQLLTEPLFIVKYSKGERQKRISDVLENLNLKKEILSKYPLSLSGGQQQIVAIGRAIITSPEILILDEPLSSLDILAQNRVIRLLKQLREKFHFTYIFISHDLGVTRDFCDEIAVLNNAAIVEQGSGLEVINNPKNAFTKELVAAISRIEI